MWREHWSRHLGKVPAQICTQLQWRRNQWSSNKRFYSSSTETHRSRQITELDVALVSLIEGIPEVDIEEAEVVPVQKKGNQREFQRKEKSSKDSVCFYCKQEQHTLWDKLPNIWCNMSIVYSRPISISLWLWLWLLWQEEQYYCCAGISRWHSSVCSLGTWSHESLRKEHFLEKRTFKFWFIE